MAQSVEDQGYQAFRILQIGFVIVPIMEGVDKFVYVLTNWSAYLSPFMLNIVNFHDRGFMTFVGIVEIILGIGIAFKPRVFAYFLFIWLLLIMLNLVLLGKFLDIALRDLGLTFASLALGRLSQQYDIPETLS